MMVLTKQSQLSLSEAEIVYGLGSLREAEVASLRFECVSFGPCQVRKLSGVNVSDLE